MRRRDPIDLEALRLESVQRSSGAILSIRNIGSITREKTGAATAPPSYAPLLGSSITTTITSRGRLAGAIPGAIPANSAT